VRHRLPRVVVVLFLTSAVGLGTGAFAAQGGPKLTAKPLIPQGDIIKAAKSRTARLAKSDASLLSERGSQSITVMVRLDYDPVASYMGGVSGLAPTSPSVTGISLKENMAAVDVYDRHLNAVDARITQAIERRIPGAKVMRSFHIAYGGLTVRLPANRAKDLLSIRGVVAIHENSVNKPLTNSSPRFVRATAVWRKIGGKIVAGSDVIVGVIDTGIWPEHPSFEDLGLEEFGGDLGCEFGDGSNPELGDPFDCQDKLVGAYAFTDTYMSIFGSEPGEFCDNDTLECSARDPNGHGTHTSSTAGGNALDESQILGVELGRVSGMTPGARVVMYRVCLSLGCFSDDSVAAVEQAILDGTDVINYSISGGSDAFSDPVELAFLDFYAAGGLANASAGNEGPGAGTANHGGPWTNTVGASTSPRHYLTTLELTADGGDTYSQVGADIGLGLEDPTEVIQAEDVPGYAGTSLCEEPFDAGSVDGLVVVCQRGVVARTAKSYNVMQGGGVGMIQYNANNADIEADNHWIPAVHVDGPPDALLEYLDTHTGITSSWAPGVKSKVTADEMGTFSSRGPLGDFIKPDVTAPGIQITAGNTEEPMSVDNGPPGELFQTIVGTSMSSPHAAGVSALVRAYHPDWTPGQIKSALMTSAALKVVKEDGVTMADPFDRGAGSIRAGWAVRSPLTFDVSADEYYAAASDEAGRIHLNLPSINAPTFLGSVTTTRTALSVSDVTNTFHVKTTAPDGASITVGPSDFTIDPGATQVLTITIDGAELADGQYFGNITLDVNDKEIRDPHMPVAFFKAEGQVELSSSCEPTSFAEGSHSDCTVDVVNHAPVNANVSLDVSSSDPDGLSIENIADPGVPTADGFTFDGELGEAAPPTIDEIAVGGNPYGYVSLASLGVPPLDGADDETLFNFGVSEFPYGSETYNTVAMVSNGYAKAGEGTAEDINYIPQDFPDGDPPNNVLGAFWTDLNPFAGGSLYAAEVGDGLDNWIVLEWENVPIYSDDTEIQTFQIWLQTTGGVESNSFEYWDINGLGDPAGLTVGAENRLGTSGAMLDPLIPGDGDAYHIETSPGPPGGAVTITYDAVGNAQGSYQIEARLESDVETGTAIEIVHLEVT
jgi:hypothetical protein